MMGPARSTYRSMVNMIYYNGYMYHMCHITYRSCPHPGFGDIFPPSAKLKSPPKMTLSFPSCVQEVMRDTR